MKAAAVDHQVVSEAEWLKARKKLLVKEKKFTRRPRGHVSRGAESGPSQQPGCAPCGR
jgi:predicted dithiol-disulfide oxidoreductase (DUF899 family)